MSEEKIIEERSPRKSWHCPMHLAEKLERIACARRKETGTTISWSGVLTEILEKALKDIN